MILKPVQIDAIARLFPDSIALIVPKFDETEGQLYDYLQSGAKPGQLDDSTLKPRCTSVMVTTDYGTKAMDGSFPTFDIGIWPPKDGAVRTDDCGLISHSYPADYILKRLIAHSQFNLAFELKRPDGKELEFEGTVGRIRDTAKVLGEGNEQQIPTDLTKAIGGTPAPTHRDEKKEQNEITKKQIAESERLEREASEASAAQLKARVASIRRPSRPTAKAREQANIAARKASGASKLNVLPDKEKSGMEILNPGGIMEQVTA